MNDKKKPEATTHDDVDILPFESRCRGILDWFGRGFF
jgi:hypothetical protein